MKLCQRENKNKTKQKYTKLISIQDVKCLHDCFHSKDLMSNSPYCLLYRSFYVTLENLVFDPLIILKLIFFSIFITYLLGMVFLMSGEILCWSLIGVRGFAWGGHKGEESKTWYTEIQQKQLHKFSDLDHNTRGFLKNLFINPWVDG